jgi:Xaa-Pro aminopeptidase
VSGPGALPFDAAALDAMMEEAGLDILLASSRHNVQYLLGGHRHHFFEAMEAIGVSRYLPLLLYVKGRPDRSAYIANRNERDMIDVHARERGGLWPARVIAGSSGTLDAMALALPLLKEAAGPHPHIGIEAGFLPLDAGLALRTAFPDPPPQEAHRLLERLRAVKAPWELTLLREASDRVVDAMLAVMHRHGPGTRKRALIEALRQEEVRRGLGFDYALVTMGSSLNRAPSDQVWQAGEILSLDSGGNLGGYIGDLCRMAVLGEPDAELQDLLGEVEAVQQAARGAVRAGVPGGEVYVAAEAALARCAHGAAMHFVAHGMGLVGHEAPRLTARGPIPYPACDVALPLRAGMVLSVETTLPHPRRGFIKLEDTVVVTATGCEGFGDRGRGWNRAGTEP